ncbi:MAG: aspartate/glutamate racemase family protein [Candidatus Jordarchaeaceae archaeon]
MKIFVICPFGSTEPYGRENLEKIARPGTEFDYECIKDVFPLNYNTFPYNMLKCINAAVERVILAEQQGYDAVVNSCVSDPGLLEMRSVVDIPVTGCFESATHLAATMGAKWSVVTVEEVVAKRFDKLLVDLYGVRQSMASIRHINIRANQLYPEITPTEEVARRVLEVSKKCVKEDGAEIIISGCTIMSALFTNYFKEDPVNVIGVPVIDPMYTAFKFAEIMVDLKKMAGYPPVSRIGLYQKQPKEEFYELRKYLASHSSPEHFYIKIENKEERR